MLEWLKCVLWRGHNWRFIRNIYGDEIVLCGWKRSIWACRNCPADQYRKHLYEP